MKARTSYAIYLLLAASAGAHSDIAVGFEESSSWNRTRSVCLMCCWCSSECI